MAITMKDSRKSECELKCYEEEHGDIIFEMKHSIVEFKRDLHKIQLLLDVL
jgi:hypothetical protein